MKTAIGFSSNQNNVNYTRKFIENYGEEQSIHKFSLKMTFLPKSCPSFRNEQIDIVIAIEWVLSENLVAKLSGP